MHEGERDKDGGKEGELRERRERGGESREVREGGERVER